MAAISANRAHGRFPEINVSENFALLNLLFRKSMQLLRCSKVSKLFLFFRVKYEESDSDLLVGNFWKLGIRDRIDGIAGVGSGFSRMGPRGNQRF